MSNISRRQDIGLGKTAAGGSGGSFASHERGAASPPPASSDPDDLMHNDAPITEDGIQELLSEHNLDFGNTEVEAGDFMTVEGPNHAVWRVDLDGFEDDATMGDLKATIAQDLDDFDPDEEFDEIWSKEFGEHNGFSAREFLDGLREDRQYFTRASDRLRAEANGDSPHAAKALAASREADMLDREMRNLRARQSKLHREELRERVLAGYPTAETIELAVNRNTASTGDHDKYLYAATAVRNARGESISVSMDCEGDIGAGAVLYKAQANGSFEFEADGTDVSLFENETYSGPMRATVNIHRSVSR